MKPAMSPSTGSRELNSSMKARPPSNSAKPDSPRTQFGGAQVVQHVGADDQVETAIESQFGQVGKTRQAQVACATEAGDGVAARIEPEIVDARTQLAAAARARRLHRSPCRARCGCCGRGSIRRGRPPWRPCAGFRPARARANAGRDTSGRNRRGRRLFLSSLRVRWRLRDGTEQRRSRVPGDLAGARFEPRPNRNGAIRSRFVTLAAGPRPGPSGQDRGMCTCTYRRKG